MKHIETITAQQQQQLKRMTACIKNTLRAYKTHTISKNAAIALLMDVNNSNYPRACYFEVDVLQCYGFEDAEDNSWAIISENDYNCATFVRDIIVDYIDEDFGNFIMRVIVGENWEDFA